MRSAGAPTGRGGPDHQRLVPKPFQGRARRWDEDYRPEDLLSDILTLRPRRARDWLDGPGRRTHRQGEQPARAAAPPLAAAGPLGGEGRSDAHGGLEAGGRPQDYRPAVSGV